MFTHVWFSVHVSSHGVQEKAPDLTLELPEVVNHLVWVLEIKHGPLQYYQVLLTSKSSLQAHYLVFDTSSVICCSRFVPTVKICKREASRGNRIKLSSMLPHCFGGNAEWDTLTNPSPTAGLVKATETFSEMITGLTSKVMALMN